MTYKEFRIQYALGIFSKEDLEEKIEHTKDKRILDLLSRDKDPDIRFCVSFNSITPNDTLEKLSKDKSSQVRFSVASNKNASQNILEKLSKDKDYNVRRSVVENPNVSMEILEKLSKDKEVYVRRACKYSYINISKVK